MLAIILLLITLLVSGGIVIIARAKGDKEGSMALFFGFVMIFGIIASVIYLLLDAISITCKEYTNYTEKNYDIYGLEFKIDKEQYTVGTFILGCGSISSGSKNSNDYYFFSMTEYGKKLETLSTSKYDVYINESDNEKPNLKTIYQKTYNVGIWEKLFGKKEHIEDIGKIITVPTNTVQIEYNVDI